jgi:hypothetical protein
MWSVNIFRPQVGLGFTVSSGNREKNHVNPVNPV